MSGGFSGRFSGHFGGGFARSRPAPTPGPMRPRRAVVRPGFSSASIPAPLLPTPPVVRRPLLFARRFVPFAFRRPFGFFALNQGFGLSFCSSFFGFGLPPRHFFFNGFFNCFPEPFLVPFAPVAEPVLIESAPAIVAQQSPLAGQATSKGAIVEDNSSEAQAFGSARPGCERSLTLLQLQDGSMYGLTEHWIEGGQLHYRTSYGGENAVPFEQIDFDKTIELNAECGVEFALRPKPVRSKPDL